MAEKKTYTHTGLQFKGLGVYKDADGVYYLSYQNALYRLDIEPNIFENVQYDDENPITEYTLTGKIGIGNNP